MKKIKAWAVVWTERGAEEYGVPATEMLVNIEPHDAIRVDVGGGRGRPKIRYAYPSAVFTSEVEAEAFRADNTDWKVVPLTISF